MPDAIYCPYKQFYEVDIVIPVLKVKKLELSKLFRVSRLAGI